MSLLARMQTQATYPCHSYIPELKIFLDKIYLLSAKYVYRFFFAASEARTQYLTGETIRIEEI